MGNPRKTYKNPLVYLASLALILGGYLWFGNNPLAGHDTQKAPETPPAQRASAADARSEATGGQIAPGFIAKAHVNSVHDGDTIWVHVEGAPKGKDLKIRLIGIDTPEVNDPKTERIGNEARDYLKKAIGKKDVWIEFDRETHDRHGRALCYIWLSDPHADKSLDNLVNYRIVRDGFGEALEVRPNTTYARDIKAAERSARADRKGLWAQGDFSKRANR